MTRTSELFFYERFSKEGFDVRVAQDAVMATREVQRFNPDLVVLDLMLPAGGGIQVLRSLRNFVRSKFIPVIVTTAMQNEDYKKEVLSLGVKKYYQKPCDAADMVRDVKEMLAAGT